MGLDRSRARLRRLDELDDEDRVDADPQTLFALVETLTQQAWALTPEGRKGVERRLQRHVAVLVRR